jgi:hypothetical protein
VNEELNKIRKQTKLSLKIKGAKWRNRSEEV